MGTGAESSRLAERLFRDDPGAREEAVESCRPLVRRLAGYFARRSRLDRDDLESSGYVGLMIALRNFDPVKARARGTRFSTYAYWWIRRYMLRQVIHDQLLISVPENVAEMHHKYRRCCTRLADLSGGDDGQANTAALARLGATPGQERAVRRREAVREYSLDQPRPGDQARRNLGEIIPAAPPEDIGAALQREQEVARCLALLDGEEREVVELLFGLTGRCPMTYREIAETIGARRRSAISRQRAHQITLRALEKIRARQDVRVAAGACPARGGST